MRNLKLTARAILFRLLAIALGLSPFFALELLCRLADWGEPTARVDPNAGFFEPLPLFTVDASGDFRETSPGKLGLFCADRFSVDKHPDELRIFCLGGSTVQGRPYAKETSFTTWLELALREADGQRTPRVVNCGGVSYASYRVLAILDEVLEYQPDLIVVYTGHNEYLERRLDIAQRARSRVRRTVDAVARRSWLVSALRGRIEGEQRDLTRTRAILPREVDALLDHRGGLAEYQREEGLGEAIAASFEAHLRRLVERCRQAGVPTVLCDPASNWRHCPPFKSLPSEALSEEDRRRLVELLERARAPGLAPLVAVAHLERALALDPLDAARHFELAEALSRARRVDDARQHYLAAKELDVCPLRAPEVLRRIVREVSEDFGVPYLPVGDLFEEESPDGILGMEHFVDHVHPTIRGHQLIAVALVETLEGAGLVAMRSGWELAAEAAFRSHFESLGDYYFAKGERRLANLRLWAAGRVDPTDGASAESTTGASD